MITLWNQKSRNAGTSCILFYCIRLYFDTMTLALSLDQIEKGLIVHGCKVTLVDVCNRSRNNDDVLMETDESLSFKL